jgi:zinc/manganese transport system permease protein
MNNYTLSLIIPAFLAGLLVLSTHVVLGREVLKRGIIFIDLAIAQVAALGVVVATVYLHEAATWMIQCAAVGHALLAALFLNWTDKHWPKQQEALIGCLFVLAASVSLLLLANQSNGNEHMHDLLAGQILWVTIADLWPVALVYSIILLIWWRAPIWVSRSGFYLLFAIAITLAVQLVGVYLVFASLIMPALATKRLYAAFLIGVAGYFTGLWASTLLDLPAGTTIVCTLAALSVMIGSFLKRDTSVR